MTELEIKELKEKHLEQEIELLTRNQYKNILQAIESNTFTEEYLKTIIKMAIKSAENINNLKVITVE